MAYICKFIFTAFFCIATLSGLAQAQVFYPFQKDDTLLKRKLYDAAIEMNKATINSLGSANQKDYKKAYGGQLDVVKDLLLTSRSVTEEKAYAYINSVAQKIITSNNELKGLEVRIVFSRDLWPNAFSIGDGTIAFNAGLFVFLQSEAEMAFILSHELAHYYLDHSGKQIKKYVETVNSDDFKKEIKRLGKQQYQVSAQYEKLIKSLVFDIRRHSRDKEEEADRVGMRFFKNTGYNGNAFISCMTLLDKVDDTAFLRPVNLETMLTFPDYPFKTKWIKKESMIFGELNAEEASGLTKQERDSLKTHPDCSKRINLFGDSAKLINGSNFLVDEKLFNQLKKDFIVEMVEECYANGNISRNLFYSLQLLDEQKNISLAVYSIARDLNKLYEQQKSHQLGLNIDSENKRFPEGYNLLLRMLNRIRLDELAELAYYFCKQYQPQMKDSREFAAEMAKAEKNKTGG